MYSAIRVRFIAQNLGAGSLVKAAIDDVDQDGLDNGLDLCLLSQYVGPGDADFNGDQIVNGNDFAFLDSNLG